MKRVDIRAILNDPKLRQDIDEVLRKRVEGQMILVADDIEVWEVGGEPRAAFMGGRSSRRDQSGAEWRIEEHYGRKVAFGLWELALTYREDLPWRLVSLDCASLIFARCDGFAPGVEE